MTRGGGARRALLGGSGPPRKTRMDVCSMQSVQRVVNFTQEDGGARAGQPVGRMVPGVTMVCDLPLLFVDGLPACLEDLTLGQLQQFVPYMIQCSGGASGAGAKPEWWPDELVFSAAPARPPGLPSRQWLACLKRVVSSCYAHHGCEYALRLCAPSARGRRSTEWTLVDGLDGTMSLYNTATRTISATFRTADVWCFGEAPPPSSPLLRERGSAPPPTRRRHVSVYLCGTCDSKFCTLKEMRIHERQCSQKCPSLLPCARKTRVISRASRVPSPNVARKSETYAPRISTRTYRNLCCPPNTGLEIARQAAVTCAASKRMLPMISDHPRQPTYGRDSGTQPVSPERKRSLELPHVGNSAPTSPILCNEPPPAPPLSKVFQSTSRCDENLTNPTDSFARPYCEKKHTLHRRKRREKKVVRRRTLLSSKQILQKYLNQSHQSGIYHRCHCEMEFTTLEDIRMHESICCKGRDELTASPVAFEKHTDFDQDTFLSYFRLASTSTSQKNLELEDTLRKKTFRHSLNYSGIPISSPLGRQIHSRYKLCSSVILGKIEKNERYCLSNPIDHHRPFGARFDCNTWRVSYKMCKSTTSNWSHTYRHPIQQWWRMPSLRKRLMRVESRNQYLLSLCKTLQIKLRRLTAEELQSFATCRTLTPKVKKLTSEEIQLYVNPRSASSRMRKLSLQELEACTGPFVASPLIRRLSFEEIQMYTGYSTSTITLSNNHNDSVATLSSNGNLNNETVSVNYSKNRRKRKRKIHS